MPYQRPRIPWKLPDGDVDLGARTLIMGVLDASAEAWPSRPDPEALVAQAQELVEQGADFLDLTTLPAGPPSKRIDANDERARLVPSLRKILYRADVPVAVTTYNSAAAERAAEMGVAVIHDPSGAALDREMPRVVARSDAALVLGHAPGPPESWKKGRAATGMVDALMKDLDSSLARARMGGLDPRRMALDPGLGMAKSPVQSYEILDRLRTLGKLSRPVMVSLGHKAFLTETIRAPEADWKAAEAAVVALAVRGGAHIIRTGDVPTARAAAYPADRLLDAVSEPA